MKALLLAALGVSFMTASMTEDAKPVAGDAGRPIEGISDAERASYDAGRRLFTRNWSAEGQAFFNARSCLACHSEPTLGGFSSSPFNHVFFVPDSANPGGTATFSWLEQRDGRTIGQRLPFGDFEVRKPQNLFGLGLLEAIPEASLRALADPGDKNRDGISGRLLDVDGKIGRFGWKGNVASIAQFTQNAFKAELGMGLDTGKGLDNLTQAKLDSVTAMTRLLAPPKPKSLDEAGKALFMKIGCASCHTPQHKTGKSDIPSLENRLIEPYSDMLLHDVGRGKPVQVTSGQASRREFRTPPLWGIGRSDGPYFHDGSTKTVDEAIDRHEGEALNTRNRYRELKADQKQSLLNFLKGL